MRVVVVLLSIAAVVAGAVGVNHAYIARASFADSPERATALFASAIMYGAGALMCLAVALVIHVMAQRSVRSRESSQTQR